MGNYRISVKDYTGETSLAQFPVDNAAADADLTDLYNAIDAVVIGTLGDGVLTTEEVKDAGSTALPTNQNAQRELKWLCKFTDDVTNSQYQREIPCPDLTQLSGNVDTLDLTAGVGATLKAEWEAVVESPVGNATTLNSVALVGRNI